MTRISCLILLSGLLATSGALAIEDYNEIFERAMEDVEFDFDKRWAYTETQVDSKHVRVGRFDPRRLSRAPWQLLSVDGREPTADEFEEYREDKAHDHSDNSDNKVSAMVEPDSVRLIEETAEYWLLGFDPDDEEKIMDSVDATIRINKAGEYLEYLDLRNHAPIKPAIGIKISTLITRLTFGPAIDDGPIVPLSTQVEVKGRAYMFVSIDENELNHNSDFEFVGQ